METCQVWKVGVWLGHDGSSRVREPFRMCWVLWVWRAHTVQSLPTRERFSEPHPVAVVVAVAVAAARLCSGDWHTPRPPRHQPSRGRLLLGGSKAARTCFGGPHLERNGPSKCHVSFGQARHLNVLTARMLTCTSVSSSSHLPASVLKAEQYQRLRGFIFIVCKVP